MIACPRPAARPWRSLAALLALLQGLAMPMPAWSQMPGDKTEQTLPAGSVLAIRLVSATEVHPTTGVLVTTDGLVLVPASFAMDEGELLVLDGGGNVARNGRRASVAQRLPGSGLVLLQVEGLRGTPLALAATPGVDGERLHFGAFPPAEQMAAGMGPMWLGVTLSANPEVGIYGLEGERPIPNVSGPLFNRCRQWAGYAVADGTPQLQSEFGPIVLFSHELRRVLDSLDIPYATGSCPPAPEQDVPGAGAPAAGPAAPAPEADREEPPTGELEQAATDDIATDSAPGLEPEAEPPPPAAPAADRSAPATQRLSSWWLAVLVLLSVACGWWLRSRRPRLPSSRSDEASAPRSGVTPTPTQFEELPAGGVFLQLLGETASGQPMRLHVPIDPQSCTVLVTRQGDGLVAHADTQDPVAAHPGQAPPAIALRADGNDLLLTVLESPQQVWLDGVGCWPDEQLYIGSEDVIMLGRTRFTVRTFIPPTP